MDAVSGKSFSVESIMGTPLNAASFAKGFPVMNFGAEGRLTGNSGCNNFNGKYMVDGEKLTLDGGAMTRMMCPGTGEQDFINALKQVNGVKTNGGKLKLMNGETEMMSLVSK